MQEIQFAVASYVAYATQTMSSSETNNRTDEKLLAAHLDGDTSAFPLLIERYKNDLLHFLIRFMGTRAAAEDVFHDTFLCKNHVFFRGVRETTFHFIC